MRKLGSLQREILRSYYQYGKFPSGGWTWDNFSNTFKVSLALEKLGYLEKKTFHYEATTLLGTFPQSYESFVITEAGKRVIKEMYPRAEVYHDANT